MVVDQSITSSPFVLNFLHIPFLSESLPSHLLNGLEEGENLLISCWEITNIINSLRRDQVFFDDTFGRDNAEKRRSFPNVCELELTICNDNVRSCLHNIHIQAIDHRLHL